MQENDKKKKEEDENQYEKLRFVSDYETNVFIDENSEKNNSFKSDEKNKSSPKTSQKNIKLLVRQIKKEDLLLKQFEIEPNPLFKDLKRSSTLANWKTRKSGNLDVGGEERYNFDSNDKKNFNESESLNKQRSILKKTIVHSNSTNTNTNGKKVSTADKESINLIPAGVKKAPISNKNGSYKNLLLSITKRTGFLSKNYSTSINKLDKYFQFIKSENKEKRKKQFTKKRLEILIKFAFYVLSNIINILAVINYIVQTFFDDRPENEKFNLFLTYIELAFTFYFLFEYIFICYKIKGSFFKHILSIDSFIDMITIIPSIITYFISFRGAKLSFIRVFRIFRVFRILRIYKSLRMIQAESYNQDEENNKSNSKLIKFDPIKLQFITIVVILICVFFIGAGLVLGVNDLVEDAFTIKAFNFVDATYFMIVTYCTLGYGDILPTTLSTRFMIIIGLFCLFVIVSDQLTRLGNLLKFWGPGLIQYNGKNHFIIIADKTINLKLFLEILTKHTNEKTDFMIISKDIVELPTDHFPFQKAKLVKREDIDLDLMDLINLKHASAVFIFSTKSNYYYDRYDKITDFFFMKITQNYQSTPPIYLQTLNSDKTVSKGVGSKSHTFPFLSKSKTLKENSIRNLKKAIPIWKIKSLILSKCTFNPGFATFIQNLLFNDYQCPLDIDDQSEVLQNYMRGCENGICVHMLPSFFTGKNFYDAMYIIYFKSINDYFVKINLEESDTNRPILLIGVYEKKKFGLNGNDNIEIFPNDYLISEGSYGVFISYNENDYIERNLDFFNDEYGKKINKKLDKYNNANNTIVSSNNSGNSENINKSFNNISDLGNGIQNKINNDNNNLVNDNQIKLNDNSKEKELYSFKKGRFDFSNFDYHKTISEKNKNSQIDNNINNYDDKPSGLSRYKSKSFSGPTNYMSGSNIGSSNQKQNFMEDNKDFIEDNKSNKRNSVNFNNIYYKSAQGIFNRFNSSLNRNGSISKFSENNPIKEENENSRDETKHEHLNNLKIEEITENEGTSGSEKIKIKNRKKLKQQELNNNEYDDIEIFEDEDIKIRRNGSSLNIKKDKSRLKENSGKSSFANLSKSSKNVKFIKKISFDLKEDENKKGNEMQLSKHFSEKKLEPSKDEFKDSESEKIKTELFYNRIWQKMKKSNQNLSPKSNENKEEIENDIKSKANKSTELADEIPILSNNLQNRISSNYNNVNNLNVNNNPAIKKVETLDLDLKRNNINSENFSELFVKNEESEKNFKIPDELGYIKSLRSNNITNHDLIKIESYNQFFGSEKQTLINNIINNNSTFKQTTISKFNSSNEKNNSKKDENEVLLITTEKAAATIENKKEPRENLKSKTHSQQFNQRLANKLFKNNNHNDDENNKKNKIENKFDLEFQSGDNRLDTSLKKSGEGNTNRIYPLNKMSQKALIKKMKLSLIDKNKDEEIEQEKTPKKPTKKYSGFVEQFAKLAESINSDRKTSEKMRASAKQSIANPDNFYKPKKSIKNPTSINNTTIRSNIGLLNLFELGFVHKDNFKNKNTIKNLEFLNEGDNTIKDIFIEQGITNEKINLKANKIYTNLTEKDDFKSLLSNKNKKPDNSKLIEFSIFDIEKDDMSKRFRNHIIIIGYQDILSKLLKLIYLHQEKDICIISTPDSDEVCIHKLLKQYDNLFYLKGSPENPFHLLNAGLNNAYMVFFLTENLFGKTNEDMQKILIYKSIDYFFNTRMILELWSSNSCRLLGNVPLLNNGEVESNEFLNPAFMAGRLIYVSHLENVTAKSYTEEMNTEVWLKLINLGLVTHHEKGHKTIYNQNLNNIEGMPIILTLDIPAVYNDREYHNLVDDLMKLNPPALPVGIYIESPLDYLRLRSRGNVKRDKTDTGINSQINITTSHKKKLVNLHKMDKIDKTYLGNLKVLRDISYNDKVFLDIVDLNNSYMPMFITNPHPGFIISSKCKVMVFYFHVTNKSKDKIKNFKLKRTIGIKNTTKNEFKKEMSLGDEFRQKQEMLKNKQEKIFGYYEILKRKLVNNIQKKYAHIENEIRMKNINSTDQNTNSNYYN